MGPVPILLGLSLLVQSPREQAQLDVKGVIDRWAAGAGLIESYDLCIEYTEESRVTRTEKGQPVRLIGPGDLGFTQHFYSHILRSGEKRYGEFSKVKDDFRFTKFWFDGTTFTSSSLPQNEYQLQSNYIMFGVTQGEDYEALYRALIGSTSRIDLSRERGARLLPRERGLYVLDVPAATTPGNWYQIAWKIWLDPVRNFLPTRLSQSIVKAGQTMRDIDGTIELAQVASGVWAPVEAKFSLYHKDPKSPIFGMVMGSGHLQVDLARSQFNVDTPDERFAVKIPNGATVVDRGRNVVYTQGASDPDAYLADLAKQGKEIAAGLPKVGLSGENLVIVPDRPSFWSRGWVIAAGAVVLGIAVIIRVGRSRRRVA